ncbi:MAG: tryptophan 2,3-dioxygenase [Calditrichaeota bacterium]|nr:MAG: tryptophan 2,3-dioxygenase [Calditrichota bacterium]
MGNIRSPVDYTTYLQLDKILNSQRLMSEEYGKPAHDEMLFIVIHQVYELWFKQILHELDSVLTLFRSNFVDEKQIGVAVARFHRIIEIQKLLIEQIRILETMTPLDFLEFRGYLTPASGFQSFQFRALEIKLGLLESDRIRFSKEAYHEKFPEDQKEKLLNYQREPSLFDLIQRWLERTPFLKDESFSFVDRYHEAVEIMLEEEERTLESLPIGEEERQQRLQLMSATRKHFQTIFDPEEHEALRKSGRRRISHDALLAALFIHLYRDEPILHLPFQLLSAIVDMDELLSAWRYRHAMMVLRMIGKKVGTGGSAGYQYLKNTSESHRVFNDLVNISTFLIPRTLLPPLPESVRRKLQFHFTVQSDSN